MAFSIRCERPVALRVAAAGSFFFLIFKNFFSPLSFFFLGGKKKRSCGLFCLGRRWSRIVESSTEFSVRVEHLPSFFVMNWFCGFCWVRLSPLSLDLVNLIGSVFLLFWRRFYTRGCEWFVFLSFFNDGERLGLRFVSTVLRRKDLGFFLLFCFFVLHFLFWFCDCVRRASIGVSTALG